MTLSAISEACLVLISDEKSLHRLGNQSGAVIGTLFHRYGSSHAVEKLDGADQSAIVETGGDHLLKRFWGRYVAVLPRPDGHVVLRDPSGMLTCHYVTSGGVFAFASSLELLRSVQSLEPLLDEHGLGRALYLPALPTENSALQGVKNLLPGMAVEIAKGRARSVPRWNPWDHVPAASNAPVDKVAGLRRMTQACVGAWARLHDKGLVGVSGGLDSSIVAAALHMAGNDLSCVTVMTRDPIGDERPYARALTAHLGVRLEEEAYELGDIDLDRSTVAHLPSPSGRLDAMAYDVALLRTMQQTEVNAIYTGHGGDNIFYMSRSARPLADRYLSEGFSLRLWETIKDLGVLTGLGPFAIMGHAVRAYRKFGKSYVWQSDPSFLSAELAIEQARTPIEHPWLDIPEEMGLPGKVAHIAMLMRMQHSIESYHERGGMPVIHPLVSQPLVEYCLSIPTWYQCRGGHDRAAARQAFADLLPRLVIDRRQKGSPDGFSFEVVRHYRKQMRERVLDGYLAAASLLDRTQVERALAPGALNSAATTLRLLHLVDAEAWISHWRGVGRADMPHP